VIDFFFGLCLLYKAFLSTFPLSTTWVFLGLVGCREIALGIKEQEFEYVFTNRESGNLGKTLAAISGRPCRCGGESGDRAEHPTSGATHGRLNPSDSRLMSEVLRGRFFIWFATPIDQYP
jgi:hypothetical protein